MKIAISALFEIIVACILCNLFHIIYRNFTGCFENIWTNYTGAFSAGDLIGYQLSLGFIVLSLTAILSSDTKIYYWTSAIELRLKKPVISGFLGYTTRLLTNIAISFILIGWGDRYIYVNFIVFLITLSMLLIRLIDVNFEKEKSKVETEKYYKWIKDNMPDEKEKINSAIKDVTNKYISSLDVNGFCENVEFLINNEEYDLLNDILRTAKEKSEILLGEFLRIANKLSVDTKGEIRDKIKPSDLSTGLKDTTLSMELRKF